MILSIKTDQPEAEIGLFDSNGREISYTKWKAHRELSNTILRKIQDILDQNSINFDDLEGIVFYEGPGSFTGLRIGASVANALEVPVVNSTGDNWQKKGLKMLKTGKSNQAVPRYGAEPHITKQKK